MKIDKSIIDDFITFTKNNPVYLFCSIIYYVLTSLMLGGTFLSFLIALVLYAVSMIAVFSVIGETILCFLERARKVETRKEKEYLLPIFEEVYQEVKSKYPNLHYIEICIIDNMNVNACALGISTVAVTKGALETFTEDELKGILAMR